MARIEVKINFAPYGKRRVVYNEHCFFSGERGYLPRDLRIKTIAESIAKTQLFILALALILIWAVGILRPLRIPWWQAA